MYKSRLDNIFGDFFSDTLFSAPWGRRTQPRSEVNIYHSDAGYELEFKAAGLQSGDVDISIDDNKLRVATVEAIADGFSRTFELPQDIDQEKIGAEIKDGIIRVLLPKLAKAEPRKIELKAL